MRTLQMPLKASLSQHWWDRYNSLPLSTPKYVAAGHFRVAVVLRFTQKRNTNVSLDPKAQH